MENRINYDKSFAHLQARNIRYLFIVDNNIESEDLINLFISNQRVWGGRYNPIIPSYNKVVPKEYLELAINFDPDYVIYSNNIDIETLKQHFNPLGFENIPHLSHYSLDGIDASHLLSLSYGFDTVLGENYLYKDIPELFPFYKLNFGFLDSEDNDSVRKFQKITMAAENKDKLDDILTLGNVFMVSRLSRVNTYRPILKCNERLKGTELIISDESNSLDDLIYFWNRELYSQGENFCLNQIYITNKQLHLLLESNKVDYFFSALSGSAGMTVSSQSLNDSDLKNIVDKINNWQSRCEPVKQIPRPKFPYKITGLRFITDYEEPQIKQTLTGKHDLIQLPSLSFITDNAVSGDWAVDILLERYENVQQNKIFLPPKEFITHLFTDTSGRINRRHILSFFVSRENKFFDFRIPTDEEILKVLILSLYKTGTRNIDEIKTSDDGLRLASLINLFGKDFVNIKYFFHNNFWLNIFRGKSILPIADRMQKSKGIVSYKDLQAEYKDVFEKEGYIFDEIVYSSENNELKENLDNLVELGAFFIGNKIKCKNCGSALWYSLQELSNNMDCKGCMQEIRLPIEELPYYKINDVIRNNLDSKSGSKNNLHGNLTVLYTLISLREQSWHSFLVLPPQNYYKRNSKRPISDIDIICIMDGSLIIGEAKNSVSEFNNKEVENLIFLGNSIEPSKIILAFKEGDEGKLSNAINRIQTGLNNKTIFVESYKIIEPWFNSINTRILKEKVPPNQLSLDLK